MRAAAQRTARARLGARSKLNFAFYARVFEATLKRGFHAVRLLGPAPDFAAARKLVIYANHPSWWDGIVYMFVSRRFLPGRAVYTPIDAAMLERYPFLGRIGGFGVDQASARGAADFLAACREALAQDAPLIVAAQGRFVDVRVRPLGLRPGLAHLASVEPDLQFVPMALDYAFWNEKRPEMLMAFGAPIRAAELAPLDVRTRAQRLETALTLTLDDLAAAAISREESRFATLLSGAGGVNPIYDAWRRLKALARGRRFSPEHGARP